MARTRKVPKDLLNDTELSKCSMQSVLFFFGLFSHFDCLGLIEEHHVSMSRTIFPKRGDITPSKVRKWIDEIVAVKKIIRLKHAERDYLFCPVFVATQYFFEDEYSNIGISLETLEKLAPELASKLRGYSPSAFGLRPPASNPQRKAATNVAGKSDASVPGKEETLEEKLARIQSDAAARGIKTIETRGSGLAGFGGKNE